MPVEINKTLEPLSYSRVYKLLNFNGWGAGDIISGH